MVASGAPAFTEHVVEERSGQGTAEVMASFTPVEAPAQHRTLLVGVGGEDADADCFDDATSFVRELGDGVVVVDRTNVGEVICERDGDRPGEVVIAGPRVRELGRYGAGALDDGSLAWADLEQTLQERGDLGVVDPVVAVAALRVDGDEAALEKFDEVFASGDHLSVGFAPYDS